MEAMETKSGADEAMYGFVGCTVEQFDREPADYDARTCGVI
jgi:hypothetical protein